MSARNGIAEAPRGSRSCLCACWALRRSPRPSARGTFVVVGPAIVPQCAPRQTVDAPYIQSRLFFVYGGCNPRAGTSACSPSAGTFRRRGACGLPASPVSRSLAPSRPLPPAARALLSSGSRAGQISALPSGGGTGLRGTGALRATQKPTSAAGLRTSPETACKRREKEGWMRHGNPRRRGACQWRGTVDPARSGCRGWRYGAVPERESRQLYDD